MQITYKESDGFQKDLKRLLKRFPTLREDLHVAKKAAIELFHALQIDNYAIFQIPGLGTEILHFYKIKKFACRSLKNRGNQSGIRIVYALHSKSNTVEFIEMYFKADQIDATKTRLIECLKQ